MGRYPHIRVCGSVGDPDPELDADQHVFEPPGSESGADTDPDPSFLS
jgi:hypothetical protein